MREVQTAKNVAIQTLSQVLFFTSALLHQLNPSGFFELRRVILASRVPHEDQSPRKAGSGLSIRQNMACATS
ncbi:MAG: hypothetical protein COW48_07580, partial [Hydrogenophilales bacterium CG17_big_fil_post_rev_8_21_14_2_50_63_12]